MCHSDGFVGVASVLGRGAVLLNKNYKLYVIGLSFKLRTDFIDRKTNQINKNIHTILFIQEILIAN